MKNLIISLTVIFQKTIKILFINLVYYKTVSLFIFVYDVSNHGSLEKIWKAFENIKKSLGKENLNAVLVAMNRNNLNEKVYSLFQ